MPRSRLTLHSEPYASTGNIGDSGLRKLLGTPSIDLAQMVVREAVQNSCDAAKLGSGPRVEVRLRTLTQSEKDAMRGRVLGRTPPEDGSREALERFRDGKALRVLEICDFGTTGLGGPTRADRIPEGVRETDFIDFLRNVGTTRDTHHGGGTYGFGKVSLYIASRCNTILVDTLPASERTRRLMACHLGRSFGIAEDGVERRFTGRHWWGEPAEDGAYVEPLQGSSAFDLASALGLPERNGDTGTSIMILDPDIDDGDPAKTMGHIAESLLWNFWPRMMRDVDDSRRLTCSLELEGRPLELPEPEEFPPLDLFCRAMAMIRSRSPEVRVISSHRPRKVLGRLAIARGLRTKRRPLVASDSIMPQTAAHIAVMRPVELVVKAFEGDPLPDARTEWAGVFVADEDDEVERAFAEAEPPAHDDWQPEILPARSHAKTYVNVAVREIRRAAKEVAAAHQGGQEGEDDARPSLAKVAGRLGGILADSEGDGAGPRRSGGRGAPTRKARASRPAFLRLQPSENGAVAVFETRITQDRARSGRQLIISASLAADGGALKEVPGGTRDMPRVLEILDDNGNSVASGPEADIGGADGRFEIRVAMPRDAGATLEAELAKGAGE